MLKKPHCPSRTARSKADLKKVWNWSDSSLVLWSPGLSFLFSQPHCLLFHRGSHSQSWGFSCSLASMSTTLKGLLDLVQVQCSVPDCTQHLPAQRLDLIRNTKINKARNSIQVEFATPCSTPCITSDPGWYFKHNSVMKSFVNTPKCDLSAAVGQN